MKNYDAIIPKKGGIRIKAGTARENRDGSIEVHLEVLPVEGALKLEVRDATPPMDWAAPARDMIRKKERLAALIDSVGDAVCPECGAVSCALRAAGTPHGTSLHAPPKKEYRTPAIRTLGLREIIRGTRNLTDEQRQRVLDALPEGVD